MNPPSIFLKLGDVSGESVVAGHTQEIGVLSFSVDTRLSTNVVQPGGDVIGRAGAGVFSVTKSVDLSSPLLLQACAGGKQLGSAIISATKQTGENLQNYAVYTLTDVRIVSLITSAEGNRSASETLQLSYQSIKLDYTQDPAVGKGTTKAGWNYKENKLI